MSGSDHPWEESRGMGFSYGYNRAERLEHYRSGRELVIMLCDIVSRGGNLLLDIGPDADGTIPVVMEERLAQIGSWLKTNGEAIYGTRPFATAKQWSAGEVPRIDYDKEFESAYDVAKLTEKAAPGQASIEAFFTTKGTDVFAILPRWPGRRFTIKDAGALEVRSASLLGGPASLRVARAGGSVVVDLPDLPEELLAQPAWVLKLGR
jgi:alpha-L-fucosidase